jgi:hypothetical protein
VQSFLRVLARKDSPVAGALRLGLHGLRATLSEALRRSPSDAAAAECQGLLEELAGLLHDAGRRPRAPAADEKCPPAEQARQLAPLREEIERSPELRDRLGGFRLYSTTDADLWGEAQRLFLRLAPAEAQRWSRRALEAAAQAGAQCVTRPGPCLRDAVEEEVYPGLGGGIAAAGLVLSPTAPLHPLVGEGPWEEDAGHWAADVSFCLSFLDLDASLHHALEAVRPLGIHLLVGANREGYTRELLARLHQVRQAGDDPLPGLHARIALDEAVHSLVHLPPAERLSWWQQHRQRVRQRLLDLAAERARRAGHRVHVRWLTGPYRQVNRFSRNDWGLEAGGAPGEVLACLRVYAEVDGRAFPGRVIYRDY